MLGCESLSTTKLFHCSVFREVTYTKIRVLTFTGSSLKQRMWGMVLSYQGVTAARVIYNAFVSFNKEGKKWCYLILLAPKTCLACNKLFLQQEKEVYILKKIWLAIIVKKYTVVYLKQRNIINFTIYI